MSIQDLIKMVENRLSALNNMKSTAVSLGDVGQVNYLDSQIEQTTLTLDQLKTLA